MSEVKKEIPKSTLDALNKVNANNGTDLLEVESKEADTPAAEDEEIDHDKEKEEESDDKEKESDKETDEIEKEEVTEETPEAKQAKEESLLAMLKESGLEISSLDELKEKLAPAKEEEKTDSPEQIAAKKLKIKQWALETNKVTAEKLDNFEKDKALSNTEIAFKVYLNDRKNETNELTNETYTEEELRTEFEEENFLYAEDGDPKRKRALQKIDLVAQTYFRDEYKDFNTLDSDFESEQTTAQKTETLNKNLTSVKSNLVKSGLSYSVKDELGTEFSIKLPLTQKALDKIPLSTADIADVSNTADITKALSKEYLFENINTILHEVATAYHSQKILGKVKASKGIEVKVSEHQQRAAVPDSTQKALDNAAAKKQN